MQMNLDHILLKHFQWKGMVEGLFEGNTNEQQASLLTHDNECELGKWIYSNEAAHLKDNEVFHSLASEIYQMIEAGKIDQAERRKEHYYEVAEEVFNLIEALKKVI